MSTNLSESSLLTACSPSGLPAPSKAVPVKRIQLRKRKACSCINPLIAPTVREWDEVIRLLDVLSQDMVRWQHWVEAHEVRKLIDRALDKANNYGQVLEQYHVQINSLC